MTKNLTVVVTNFRRADLLERCVRSVTDAGVSNIVVSTMEPSQKTLELHQQFRAQGIDVTSLDNDLGCNELWLRGLYRASTEYVLILHDDDTLQPEFGQEWETVIRPQLESGAAGFASWWGYRDDGTVSEPVKYFTGPTRVCGSAAITTIVRRPRSFAISPVVSVFHRDDAIRALKECGQYFIDTACFSRQGMLLGNEILLYLRHGEKYSSWLYVDKGLTTYGAHPDSETVRNTIQRTEHVLIRGYDWAREYFTRHNGLSVKPAPKFLHVCSDWEPTEPNMRRKVEAAKFAWQFHYNLGEVVPFLVTDEMLLRSSKTVLGDSRAVPFVRDLLDYGCHFALPEDIVLLSNRDVGLVVPAIDRIRERFADPLVSAAFAWRRSFYPSPGQYYTKIVSGAWDGGVDLVMARPGWWEQYREWMPDMLIACEAWDWVFRLLVAETHPGRDVSLDGLLFHEPHKQFWASPDNRRKNVGQRHNMLLAKNFFAARGQVDNARGVGGYGNPGAVV